MASLRGTKMIIGEEPYEVTDEVVGNDEVVLTLTNSNGHGTLLSVDHETHEALSNQETIVGTVEVAPSE